MKKLGFIVWSIHICRYIVGHGGVVMYFVRIVVHIPSIEDT